MVGAPERVGRFVVRGVLGEGAFGRVYRGHDPELGREVAIKVPLDAGLSDRAREQFLREARAAATIDHPNVCPVYDVGADSGLPYIVMKFVQGPTLSAFLDTRPMPLPEREAVGIARRLALGVAAAHARGVVHRDLKPGNVLVDEVTGEVLVTDFGLARVAGESGRTAPGAVMGTPAYMAPEQARGDVAAIGPASDVYALGVIFYRLLTGESPFRGSADEVIAQALATEPRPPVALRPALDARLNDLCLRALAKPPADRPASAARFADVLGDYLGLLPEKRHGGAAETRTAVALPRVSARRTQRSAVVGVALLSAAVVGAGIWFRPDAPGDPDRHSPPGNPSEPTPTAGKSGTEPVPVPKTDPLPPPGHVFDQAAERRAAEWVLDLGGQLEIVSTGDSGPRFVHNKVALPPAFRVSGILIHGSTQVTDAAVQGNLSGLSGPVRILLPECTRLTDVGVAVLAKIPELVELSLVNQRGVTDKGVLELARHPELRLLGLEGVKVTEEMLPALESLSLTNLSLWGTPVTDEWLTSIGRIKTLVDLNISNPAPGGRVTADGLARLHKLDKLSGILLGGTAVDGDGLKALARLPALEALYAHRTPLGDADLVHLKAFPRLKRVSVQGSSRVTDAGMKHLAACPALVQVDVAATTVGDEGVRDLCRRKSFRRISIDGTRVTNRGVGLLSELPELEHLFVLDLRVTDEALESLSRCPTITRLSINSPAITDNGVAHLRKLTRLEGLVLGSQKVTDNSVAVLSELATLRGLDPSGTRITPEALQRLRLALPRCVIGPFRLPD